MAKFKKFEPQEHIAGLVDAALRVQAEELIRDGKMPDLETVLRAVAVTRARYEPLMEEARKER